MALRGRLAQLALSAAQRGLWQQACSSSGSSSSAAVAAAAAAAAAVQQYLPTASSSGAAGWLSSINRRGAAYTTGAASWQAATSSAGAVTTPGEKYAHLADKDIWDEAWAYEPRFGTEDNPILVPALLSERIIGVTDPEDDTLVIWGVIREGEPPKQLVAGGEFFVLQRVDRVEKVGDKLNIPLAAPRSSIE